MIPAAARRIGVMAPASSCPRSATTRRFNDLDLMLLKTSYVFPIARRLEMDLHSEWGSVYGDVWHDAKPNTLHNSYGFSLRGRYVTGPIAAIGLDFSREGMRATYALGRIDQ